MLCIDFAFVAAGQQAEGRRAEILEVLT